MSEIFENVSKVLKSRELLGVLALLFVIAQGVAAWSSHRGAELQEESYISSLQSNYQGDIRECIQLSGSTQQPVEGEEASAPDPVALTNQCIDSVNDQRPAELLRARGHSSLLEEAQ